MNSFYEQVYQIVGQIPHGRVVSYGQIGWMLGHPRAARAVGQAMRHCPDQLPWHRVVLSDGSVAGGLYADLRRAMLQAEGVPFLAGGRVDLTRCRWSGQDTASAASGAGKHSP